jgi:hypothetical protein
MSVLIACFLGMIVGLIADSKGRNFWQWWAYGTLLFIVAIVHVLFISSTKGLVRCPKCAELIREEATICKHCKSEVVK